MRLSKRPMSALVALGLAAAAGAVVLGSSPATASTGGGGGQSGPSEVSGEQHHDRSRPLREMPSKPWNNETFVREHPAISPAGATTPRPDGALQAASAPSSDTATAGIGFDGLGNGFPGFGVNSAPPDTTGAVGDTQYVQWVNTAFAVFNKADGKVFPGFPKYGNTLWTGFGGGCEVNNDGDPVVQYDKLAQRWVLTQFSVSNPATYGYLQCVAVSTTSDATGSYNRYAFRYGASEFNDYPKLGVWPDGYYLSFNIFTNGNAFAGAKVCALDRAKMLIGAVATQQCFQTSTTYGGLLPTDLDGTNPPPPGAPNVFAAFGANRLDLWTFHVDWATPANTKFAGPTPLGVSAFSEACAGGTCIPQGGTSQQLDSLADRLMYRLAYRNFGDHDSWVVTHSVAAAPSVGVRWYELRGLAGLNPSIAQQGTYAPNADYRWMGSAAMDGVGNVAVGYSLSSSTRPPSIAYATHTTEAPGVLGAETLLWAGGGSQSTGLSRWGDYSTMTVDPVDDCTFWYSTEYLKANGTFNWSTRIASFRLSSCTPKQAAPPSAPTGLTASPGNGSVALHWSAPASSGGAAVTGYQVYRDGAAVGPAVTGNDYTDAGLTNNQAYSYQVAATNRAGVGALSAPVTATPVAAPRPGAPANLAASRGNQLVTLTWSPPLTNAAGVTSYNVYRDNNLLPSGPGASTSFTDRGLSNGTTYAYAVTAVGPGGEGDRASISAIPAAAPGAPNLTAKPATSTRGVVLTWPAANSNGSPITAYTVYRSTSAGRESSYATSSCTAASCSYNDSGARSGRRYYYQLSATNAIGVGPRSPEVLATAR